VEKPGAGDLGSLRREDERSAPGAEFLANMGIYVFKREALFRCVRACGCGSAGRGKHGYARVCVWFLGVGEGGWVFCWCGRGPCTAWVGGQRGQGFWQVLSAEPRAWQQGA
jgi:hypothetical protein